MKTFVNRPFAALLTVSCVLFATVCVLGGYIYYDFRADSERTLAEQNLRDTLLKTNVRSLADALSEENRVTAYHFAKNAADAAADTEHPDTVRFFRTLSDAVAGEERPLSDLAAAVTLYLETGDVPSDFAVSEEGTDKTDDQLDSEPASVSYFRALAAEECASAMIGVEGVLRPAEKSRTGEYVFTCRNAYAVVDARTGAPLEAEISVRRGGEGRMSEADCRAKADEFLRTYFPPDIANAAVLTDVKPGAGTFGFGFRSGEKNISLTVSRVSGRVVRLVAR